MQTYVDIHSHILPGVDDGAGNAEMSINMLRIAAGNGIGQIILTPHNKPMHHNISPEKIKILSEELQNTMDQENINIKLYTGNEVYYRSDILEILENRKVCTLAESSYVLVEFGPMEDFDYIRGGIYQIMSGGYRPILAHAERYGSICAGEEQIRELIGMGCLIQVNAGSIMGQYGCRIKKLTRRLLKNRLIHFIATDAHNDGKRSPCLKDCADYIGRRRGMDYLEELLVNNPSHIIADEYI